MRLVSAALVMVGIAWSTTASAQLTATAPAVTGAACDDLPLPVLASAIRAEIIALGKKSSSLAFPGRSVSAAEYARTTLTPLAQLAEAGDLAAFCSALSTRFAWFRVSAQPILLTGYHTPSLPGSLTQTSTFRWPLYKRPPDANNYSTAQILGGALNGKGLELLWLNDPYDALALHVEGAANINLPDGQKIHVGADGHNGMTYQNVSKLLAADGKMPSGPPPVTTKPGNPKARKYFTDHPADLNVYWSKNPHFVYFKLSPHGGGGKLGALTPGRSIAIDPAFVPFGSALFIKAQKPVIPDGGGQISYVPYTRVVLGQDTGAGIKGPGRIDVYFGDDDYAQQAAQITSVKGDAYVLLAK